MIVEVNGSPKNAGPIEVITPFEVTSLSPTERIDVLGGDILTITGRGFPTDPNEVSVLLDDGTDCVIQTLTTTSLTCRLNEVSDVGTFVVSVVKSDGEYCVAGTINVIIPLKAFGVYPDTCLD